MLYGLLSTSGVSFTPAKDIPDLSGKVIFITGGNAGLGKESALQLSAHNPSHIYLSCRDGSKAKAAIQDIQSSVPSARLTFIQCDLTSLASVLAAAQEFTRVESRLDILMLNAGIMAVPPSTTEDGYEIQFGTNHVGHALLTKLLMLTLLRTAEAGADVRVVALSSIAHVTASGIQFSGLKSAAGGVFTNMTRYGQSKLANILFVRELQRRYGARGVTAVAVHPGIVRTELYGSVFGGLLTGAVGRMVKAWYTSVGDGARGQLWAATGKKGEVVGGGYYTPVGVVEQCTGVSRDTKLAAELWEWTEKELEAYNI
ncbi:putative oxidoreductase [Lachnellula hyalina]|uniref:Putative oxidoreductase n=1 Tax=Lachnellula hyalina TaxID=1316788 RepID=A0A8H8TYX2_9HELO|nr:putative oxidoreductase [Lachnellula hyalina]TVY25312.1 putative oxidoreductase [Lachnellula hyalina]